MVPRIRKISVPLRTSISPVLDDISTVPIQGSLKSNNLLRGLENQICADVSLQKDLIQIPLKTEFNESRKRCLSEIVNNSSIKRRRNCMEELSRTKYNSVSDNDYPMFKGLAGITLNDEIFESVSLNFDNVSSRQCFQPSWSLIGTFKTNLYSLVDVDQHHDILKWYQKTPTGDFKQMRICLSAIQDVRIITTTEEEVGAHWVIVRTTTKPSQIVFGFRKLSDARRMKGAI